MSITWWYRSLILLCPPRSFIGVPRWGTNVPTKSIKMVTSLMLSREGHKCLVRESIMGKRFMGSAAHIMACRRNQVAALQRHDYTNSSQCHRGDTASWPLAIFDHRHCRCCGTTLSQTSIFRFFNFLWQKCLIFRKNILWLLGNLRKITDLKI